MIRLAPIESETMRWTKPRDGVRRSTPVYISAEVCDWDKKQAAAENCPHEDQFLVAQPDVVKHLKSVQFKMSGYRCLMCDGLFFEMEGDEEKLPPDGTEVR